MAHKISVRRTFADFEAGLKLGDVLCGRVVEPEGNDNYIVNLSGFNVMAYSRAELVPGMKIQALVNSLFPRVELIIVAGNEPRGKMLRIDRAV